MVSFMGIVAYQYTIYLIKIDQDNRKEDQNGFIPEIHKI